MMMIMMAVRGFLLTASHHYAQVGRSLTFHGLEAVAACFDSSTLLGAGPMGWRIGQQERLILAKD